MRRRGAVGAAETGAWTWTGVRCSRRASASGAGPVGARIAGAVSDDAPAAGSAAARRGSGIAVAEGSEHAGRGGLRDAGRGGRDDHGLTATHRLLAPAPHGTDEALAFRDRLDDPVRCLEHGGGPRRADVQTAAPADERAQGREAGRAEIRAQEVVRRRDPRLRRDPRSTCVVLDHAAPRARPMRKLPGYPRIGTLSGPASAAAPSLPERGMGDATPGLGRRPTEIRRERDGGDDGNRTRVISLED